MSSFSPKSRVNSSSFISNLGENVMRKNMIIPPVSLTNLEVRVIVIFPVGNSTSETTLEFLAERLIKR